MLTGQGRGNDDLLLGQAAPLPFFSLPVSLPFLSHPLEVGPYSSSSLPSIPFPSHLITTVKKQLPQPTATGRKWLCAK